MPHFLWRQGQIQKADPRPEAAYCLEDLARLGGGRDLAVDQLVCDVPAGVCPNRHHQEGQNAQPGGLLKIHAKPLIVVRRQPSNHSRVTDPEHRVSPE